MFGLLFLVTLIFSGVTSIIAMWHMCWWLLIASVLWLGFVDRGCLSLSLFAIFAIVASAAMFPIPAVAITVIVLVVSGLGAAAE